MNRTMQQHCSRCGTVLCETKDGPSVCPRCELAGALGEAGESDLPFSGEFGSYVLESVIAHGGMGAVYRAYHRDTGQTVAIKTLLAGRMASKEMRERFLREARLASKLDHPNIVPMLEVGEVEGLPYIAMKYLPGKNLADLVRDGPLPPMDAAELMVKVCKAVTHAHEHGVLHRDIKPGNILFDQTGEPHVADFGVARPLNEFATELTVTGQVLGSPAYLAPERVPSVSGMQSNDKETTGVASDVYSLGATLYHLLTGRPVFQGATIDAVLMQVAKSEPISPRKLNPSVPGALEAVCLKCLQKEPQLRYATALELAEDLERFLAGEPVQARLPGPVARGARWCRRNRALASTAGLVVLLLLAVAIGSPIALLRINRERQRAEKLTAGEMQQRRIAEDLTVQGRRRLYAARINLAQQIFDEGDVARVEELLESLNPRSDEEDLRGFEWYYLRRLCNNELVTFAGHTGIVRTVAFSPDTRTIASGGDDGVVRLWDAANGQEKEYLQGHTGIVSAVAFSPDGQSLASAGSDGVARLWSFGVSNASRILWRERNALSTLAFFPDGRKLAAGTALLAMAEGTPISRYFPQPPKPIYHVSIWDLEKMSMSAVIVTNSYGVYALAISPDLKSLASAGKMQQLKIRDTLTAEVRATVTNRFAVFGLSFSPNGENLALACWSPHQPHAEIKILETKTWKQNATRIERPGPVTCLAYSPDGRTLATGGKDQLLRLWDADTGEFRMKFAGHTNVIWAIAWSPDSHKLASASWDGTVRVWDATRQQEADRIRTADNFSAAFSSDGHLFVTGGQRVQLWDSSSLKQLGTLWISTTNDVGDAIVAFSPNGKTIASATSDGAVRLFDTRKANYTEKLIQLTNRLPAVAFSPDGETLALAVRDDTVRLLDMKQKNERLRLRVNSNHVHTLAFTPDGTKLITGDNPIKFWNPTTGAELGSYTEHAIRLAVSPDGKLLAAAVENFSVTVFELATMTRKFRLKGHKDEIFGMAFSPDGKTLATASWDGTLKLWHVASGEPLMTFKTTSGMAWCVAFSPENGALAFGSGSQNGPGGEVTVLRAAIRRKALTGQ